ncbi:MAG: 30S ribosomal protein S12 methylthiotransferase RimO [Treponema sp.]|jgi:ribosomal protein S12 methylthiotransferase|nr:30S ribosomal protein S12 methylthiotransferase RimO [Treponema sp.]
MIFYLDPFGCAKNQVDAENIMALLGGAGWTAAEDPEAADLIIVNSCGFIESAKRESVNAVLAWRSRYPGKKILLAGCLAQRYGAELAESLPEADGIFGNRNLAGIAGAAAALGGSPAASAVKAPSAGAAGPGRRPLLSLPGSAYVKIAEGCDNRCSFCAIPLIRGGLKSRPAAPVLDECRTLLDRGVRELCLIGQDLGSYGGDLVPPADLPLLMEALSALEGDFWIRLLYIHPDHFPPSLPDLCRRDRRFLPYFDIPFQHGSAPLLRSMNRRGSAETYLGLIERIRTALPGAVIRSTFMTGFPGETEADFAALLDFQERARLDWLGVFTYSREEDTAAGRMKNRVPKKRAAERKRIVEERQIPITEKNMDRFTGRDYDVLVEEKIEGEEGLYLGRLYCHAPEVDGAAVIHGGDGPPLEPGTFIKGRVFARTGFDLQVTPGPVIPWGRQ